MILIDLKKAYDLAPHTIEKMKLVGYDQCK